MLTNMADWRRTHSCGVLTDKNIDEEVLLMSRPNMCISHFP